MLIDLIKYVGEKAKHVLSQDTPKVPGQLGGAIIQDFGEILHDEQVVRVNIDPKDTDNELTKE